jgi:methylmalonyl-CoA/ethylmalonyl-CoA epimerase
MTALMLGNKIITQVGIIVSDIETKALAGSEILGLPMPNIIMTDTVDKTQAEYSGKSTTHCVNYHWNDAP